MVTVSLSKDKKKLIIEADIETPTPSSSGKTLVVCSTRGNMRTTVMIEGQPLTIGLNCYIPKGAPAPGGQAA